MQRWSEEHRAFATETFFKNNDSATVTRRVFQRHFDIGRNGKVPTRQTILNWVTQFRTTASIVDKKPSGRPQTVQTLENMRRVESHGQCQTTCPDVPTSNGAHLSDIIVKK